MKTATMFGAAAVLALLAGPVMAQTAMAQTVMAQTTMGQTTMGQTTMAPGTMAGAPKSEASNDQTAKVTTDGYLRASKLVGADVYNSADTSIGTLDDLLLGQHDKATTAVVSVGGFLGIDSKLVEVPFAKLKLNKEGHLVLAGASKASLTKLSAYSYNK